MVSVKEDMCKTDVNLSFVNEYCLELPRERVYVEPLKFYVASLLIPLY